MTKQQKETDNPARAVLAGLTWVKRFPDGSTQTGLPLSELINRLAMEDVSDPQSYILRLLSSGQLKARGDYNWKKYQGFEQYYIEEENAEIPLQRWTKLEELITASGRRSNSWSHCTLQLNELGLKDCAKSEWVPADNRFSFATLTDKLSVWNRDYREEFFSVWHIEAWPAGLTAIDDIDPPSLPASSLAPATNRGRKPAQWWPNFAEELAVYIHEEGLPEGVHTEGQDQVIASVFARMSARGVEEGSRTTVQPVVRAVLLRLRQAGK